MIFARRSIQHFIDQLSRRLPSDAIADLVRMLNRNGVASLDFEWEIAVLFASDKLGTIAYEKNHGGRSNPDVTFSLPESDGIDFVADIATVSDRGLEDENPIELLSEFLRQKAKKLGLPGGFQYQIAGAAIGKRYDDRKVKLAMPSRKQLPHFFEKHVTPRLKEIKAHGLKRVNIPLHYGSCRLSISYDSEAHTGGGAYLSYTAAYSLTRNPIYTSLKRKAQQLRDSGFDGCKGIILCDGNCALLRSRMTGVENYSDHQIVEKFLSENSSVSFVATLWIEKAGGVFGRAKACWTRMKLFRNSGARFPLPDAIAHALSQFPTLLPPPANDALNASREIAEGKYGIGASHYGGSTMSIGNRSTSIRISSRALLDLLAGKVPPNRFIEDHFASRTVDGAHIVNPFEIALRKGQTISDLSVEKQRDDDDDWITFKLSGPDAGVSPFRIP